MKSPFPGMDPYLEARWSDVHPTLITLIREDLQPQLPRALRARSEERVLLESIDDVEVRQYRPDVALVESGQATEERTSLHGSTATIEPVIVRCYDGPTRYKSVHIVDVTNGNRVVTAIEVLSPWNKAPGKLNQLYIQKLRDYQSAEVSIVELDLLRYPPRGRLLMSDRDLPPNRQAPYLACVQRGWRQIEWLVYPLSLRRRLPDIPVPLRPDDSEVYLHLQPLIERVYEGGGHDDIDYSKPPEPPLAGEYAAWAEELLKAAGKR